MKIKSFIVGSCMLGSAWVPVSAQQNAETDSMGQLSIHGNVDFYYKNSFHGLHDGVTSFTSTDRRFELGMASLQLGYQSKKAGIMVDLGFGPRARDFAYTDNGTMAAIKQAYIYYEPVAGLKLTAGSWATHIGYELLDPALNANYSMSYLFSTGPFSNTGLKAEYTTGAHHWMVGVSNPTDYRQVPEDMLNRKTIIARYSYETSGGLILALNYSGGKQVDTANLQQLDAVATVPVNSKITLGWNGSIVYRKYEGNQVGIDRTSQHWWGQALYVKASLVKNLQLALREEYFEDKYGISVIPLRGKVWSSTATISYNRGPFTLMPEIRWDHFTEPYGGDPHHGQLYGLMAVTYQF